MPASAVLSQYTFANLGPMTTTYTAPAACYTPTQVGLAPDYLPEAVAYVSTCAERFSASDCVQAGSVFDEDWAESTRRFIHYYSPGLVCPDRWTTAGVASKGNGTAIDSTGVFAPTGFGTHAPVYNPAWNIAMENLADGETAILCCPSGYTAGVGGGGCYTNLPVSMYTATTGCQNLANPDAVSTVTFIFNGTTATGRDIGPGSATTTVSTFQSGDLDEMTGISMLPMVTMYHRTVDVPPKETNAAGKFGVKGGDGTIGTLVTVWASVALMGAILFGAA
ncbi:uncharacterized protein B0I36DRAFT_359807 [Microdochium trichocladiopsis]|uniref:Uncharacterized protein n=1 Tax=Microdochium trichocladiopsis TaxID=1682393 RepID=A0A9P9BUJ6_9PEZI|nr:uncharacterized protein B0I36DRAFT_359807 [Microdochium trichocladiopsis]KAH7038217.1 hypothetical protein B0I36DRAFT_359807 [Microdochium trichocladiopsis]